MSKVNPVCLARLFWKCPICQVEDCIHVHKGRTGLLRSRSLLHCDVCGSEWGDLSLQSLTLINGKPELLGQRSLEGWIEMIQAPVWAPGTVKETIAILHVKEIRSNRQLSTWAAWKEAVSIGSGFFYYGGAIGTSRGKPILLRALDRGRFAVSAEGVLFSGPAKRLYLPWSKLSSIDFELHYNLLEVRDIKEMYCFCFSGKGVSGKESAVKWYEYTRVLWGSYRIRLNEIR